MALVRPENLVTSRLNDSSLSDLGPSMQVIKPVVLSEVPEQVHKTILHKEVWHALALQDYGFV